MFIDNLSLVLTCCHVNARTKRIVSWYFHHLINVIIMHLFERLLPAFSNIVIAPDNIVRLAQLQAWEDDAHCFPIFAIVNENKLIPVGLHVFSKVANHTRNKRLWHKPQALGLALYKHELTRSFHSCFPSRLTYALHIF